MSIVHCPLSIVHCPLVLIYANFGSIPQIAAVLDGFKAVVVAIVVEAVLKIGQKAFKTNWHIVIAGMAFVAIYFFHIPFPLIVLGALIIGFGYARLKIQDSKFKVQGSKLDKKNQYFGKF